MRRTHFRPDPARLHVQALHRGHALGLTLRAPRMLPAAPRTRPAWSPARARAGARHASPMDPAPTSALNPQAAAFPGWSSATPMRPGDGPMVSTPLNPPQKANSHRVPLSTNSKAPHTAPEAAPDRPGPPHPAPEAIPPDRIRTPETRRRTHAKAGNRRGKASYSRCVNFCKPPALLETASQGTKSSLRGRGLAAALRLPRHQGEPSTPSLEPPSAPRYGQIGRSSPSRAAMPSTSTPTRTGPM